MPDPSDSAKEFLEELRKWTGENIAHQRTHLQQICIIAGAIAAFLMPVYFSERIPDLQHSLVSISIVMLLLCIVIGMISLWQILTTEAIDLKDMRISIEEMDEERKRRYDERKEKRLKRRDQPDIVNLSVHLLFAGAIATLVLSIVIGE